MIAKLYRLPDWFLSPDDKPSNFVFLQCVNTWPESYPTMDAKTISQPTLDTIVVQSSLKNPWYGQSSTQPEYLTFQQFNSYNYIGFFEDDVGGTANWYQITEMELVSSNNHIVQITGKLDVYLTFIVSAFVEVGENNQNDINWLNKPVYFKQKHMNRWLL